MALVVLLLIKVYLGVLARLHTYGIKHWTHTEDEILASTKLMASLFLTAVRSGCLSFWGMRYEVVIKIIGC